MDKDRGADARAYPSEHDLMAIGIAIRDRVGTNFNTAVSIGMDKIFARSL